MTKQTLLKTLLFLFAGLIPLGGRRSRQNLLRGNLIQVTIKFRTIRLSMPLPVAVRSVSFQQEITLLFLKTVLTDV